MNNESTITPDEMRVLLVELGAVKINESSPAFEYVMWSGGGKQYIGYQADHTYGTDEPWFVLACLRFLESEKARESGIKYEAEIGEIAVIARRTGGFTCLGIFTDPDPAVRWVRAAAAVAKELAAQRDQEGGR